MFGKNINFGCIPTQFIIWVVDKRSVKTAVTNIQHKHPANWKITSLVFFKYPVITSVWQPCKFMRQKKKYHNQVFALSKHFTFTGAEAWNLTTPESLKAEKGNLVWRQISKYDLSTTITITIMIIIMIRRSSVTILQCQYHHHHNHNNHSTASSSTTTTPIVMLSPLALQNPFCYHTTPKKVGSWYSAVSIVTKLWTGQSGAQPAS